MPDVKRVVLAYSGGLDTSVILRWLIETYKCEVVAYCADLGQGEELIPIRDKARKTGAVAVHVVDLRETFVRDFIFPMLRANAVYEGAYLLGTSIARPLIAQAQVEIALKEHADAVAHGAARQDVPAHPVARGRARRADRAPRRFRARRSGGRGRPAHGPRGPLDDAQPDRRRARHRPRRPGREPVRRDEIARRVRDAGR